MKKENYKYFENPPTTKKKKMIGDIWFAKVRYKEIGNYYKPRPVLIIDYVEDKYLCLKITTKPKGIEIKNSRLKKKSYLTDKKIILEEYQLYELIQRGVKYGTI